MLQKTLLVTIAAMALGTPKAAPAAQITATLTGTVYGGVDQSGIFIPAGTYFSGQSFTLIYTFDDTKGQQTVSANCATGAPCYSSIVSTSSSNPGTAVLSIGNASFAFGPLPNLFEDSYAYRYVPPYSDGNAQFGFSEDYDLTFPDGNRSIGSSFVQASVIGALGTVLTTDYDWRAPFFNGQLSPSSDGQFGIDRSLTNSSSFEAANGYFSFQTITVSGPSTNPTAPEPSTYALLGSGLVAIGALAHRYRKQ